MAQGIEDMTCGTRCGIIAGVAGFVLWLLMMFAFGWGWFISLLIAVVIGAVLWFVLPRYVCPEGAGAQGQGGASGTRTSGSSATTPSALAGAKGKDAAVSTGGTAPADTFEAPTPADAPAATPSAMAGAKGADAAGSTPASAPAKASEAPTPADPPAKSGKSATAKPAAEKKAVPKKAAPKKAAPKKAGAASKTAAAPEAGDGPEMLDAPRGGTADDLKRISGVGPKLEETLNDMGVWHFDQIAKWGKSDIAWVDSRLRFKGRIERDDWMAQAKVLAEGGETEFSGRKKT